jgi:glc operon protein GlcG
MVCAVDGGFPLLRDGRIVGSIGVSGMNPTQDAFIAQAGAAALQAVSGGSDP